MSAKHVYTIACDAVEKSPKCELLFPTVKVLAHEAREEASQFGWSVRHLPAHDKRFPGRSVDLCSSCSAVLS